MNQGDSAEPGRKMPLPKETMTKPMRCMAEMVVSNDDPGLPTRIQYPSVMTHAELADLKGFVAIWLRQMERNAVESFDDMYQPEEGAR